MSFSTKSFENDDNDNHHIKNNRIGDIIEKSDETNNEPLDPRIHVRSNINLLKF